MRIITVKELGKFQSLLMLPSFQASKRMGYHGSVPFSRLKSGRTKYKSQLILSSHLVKDGGNHKKIHLSKRKPKHVNERKKLEIG